MLEHLFDAFKDIEVIYGEIVWTVLANKEKTVVKRWWDAGGTGRNCNWNETVFKTINDLQISVLNIIRNPFDVLTSKIKGRGSYHISPERYLNCLRSITIEEKTIENYQIIRYEDIVTFPDKMQNKVAKWYDLEIKYNWSDYPIDEALERKKDPRWIALTKVRPLSPDAIGRWKRSQDDKEYVQRLLDKYPQLRDFLRTYWKDYSFETDLGS